GGLSRSDAADARHSLAGGDQGVPRSAQGYRGQTALRQWRRRGVPYPARGHQPQLADRAARHDLPRADHGAALSPRGPQRRQAHHPGRRGVCRCHQPRSGAGRDALKPACRRQGGAGDAYRPRQGDLCAAWARAEEAGSDLRRHRRDPRLPHRDQRHLADRHPSGGSVRRTRHRRHDLGRGGGKGEAGAKAMTGRRKNFGAVFDAPTTAEFQTRDIDATMATMGGNPHVTHVPVMTGGCGTDSLRSFFYETWFIGRWPEDVEITLVSRTIGDTQLVDELVLTFTHDYEML